MKAVRTPVIRLEAVNGRLILRKSKILKSCQTENMKKMGGNHGAKTTGSECHQKGSKIGPIVRNPKLPADIIAVEVNA